MQPDEVRRCDALKSSKRMHHAPNSPQKNVLEQRLGAVGAKAFMAAGVAGMSPTKLDDVKCLHAHLADFLIRGDG